MNFKNLLITYKSINDMVPDYLCDLVSIRKSFSQTQIIQLDTIAGVSVSVFSVAPPPYFVE